MSAAWKARREGGGRAALLAMRAVASWCGRAPARLLLYLVTLYFLLRRGADAA